MDPIISHEIRLASRPMTISGCVANFLGIRDNAGLFSKVKTHDQF